MGRKWAEKVPENWGGEWRAECLDVCAGEVVLAHYHLLEVHVVRKRHPRRVNLEDASFGAFVRQRKLDLTVDAPGTNQCRVQRFDSIRCHNHLPNGRHIGM